RLGIVAAAVFLAEAAIAARRQLAAEGIDVRLRHVCRGARKWLQPKLLRRGFELLLRKGHVHRRVGILRAARTFERVPALNDLAVQVAGLAADAAQLLEAVV